MNPVHNIVAVGDSISYGAEKYFWLASGVPTKYVQDNLGDANTTRYSASYLKDGNIWLNFSTPGWKISDLVTQAAAFPFNAFVNDSYVPDATRPGRINVLCVLVGSNRVSSDPAVEAASIGAYCLARKAGPTQVWDKIIIGTVIARGDAISAAANFDTLYAGPLNAILRDPAWMAAHGVDACADFAAIPQLGPVDYNGADTLAYNNTTYFDGDKVHPTAAGANLMKQVFLPVLYDIINTGTDQTATAFVSSSGSDSTGVIDDKNHPFLTLNKCVDVLAAAYPSQATVIQLLTDITGNISASSNLNTLLGNGLIVRSYSVTRRSISGSISFGSSANAFLHFRNIDINSINKELNTGTSTVNAGMVNGDADTIVGGISANGANGSNGVVGAPGSNDTGSTPSQPAPNSPPTPGTKGGNATANGGAATGGTVGKHAWDFTIAGAFTVSGALNAYGGNGGDGAAGGAGATATGGTGGLGGDSNHPTDPEDGGVGGDGGDATANGGAAAAGKNGGDGGVIRRGAFVDVTGATVVVTGGTGGASALGGNAGTATGGAGGAGGAGANGGSQGASGGAGTATNNDGASAAAGANGDDGVIE